MYSRKYLCCSKCFNYPAMVTLELSRGTCGNVIPLIHFLSPFILYSGPWGELEAIPAITGNTLDTSVYHRTDGERQVHLHLWTVLINRARMSLDCGVVNLLSLLKPKCAQPGEDGDIFFTTVCVCYLSTIVRLSSVMYLCPTSVR